MGKHSHQRREFRTEERAIRAIVKRHMGDAFLEAPEDEFDCLVHHIIGALHRGDPADAVARLIHHEMVDHFGLKTSTGWAFKVAQESMDWNRNDASA